MKEPVAELGLPVVVRGKERQGVTGFSPLFVSGPWDPLGQLSFPSTFG